MAATLKRYVVVVYRVQPADGRITRSTFDTEVRNDPEGRVNGVKFVQIFRRTIDGELRFLQQNGDRSLLHRWRSENRSKDFRERN